VTEVNTLPEVSPVLPGSDKQLKGLVLIMMFLFVLIVGVFGYNFYLKQKMGFGDKKDGLAQELTSVSGVRIVNSDLNNRQVSYSGKIVKKEGKIFELDVDGKLVDISMDEEVLVRVLPEELLSGGSFAVDEIVNNLKTVEVESLLVGERVEILTETDNGKLKGILCDVYRSQG